MPFKVAELSELQLAYREYFEGKMEEHGIDGLADLSEEKLKEFFNDVSAGWVKGKGPKKPTKKSSEDPARRLNRVASNLMQVAGKG